MTPQSPPDTPLENSISDETRNLHRIVNPLSQDTPQSEDQPTPTPDPIIPPALAPLGSRVTTIESIAKLKEMATTIVNAFNQNLQDVREGKGVYTNPANRDIIRFAIGDSRSIIPAMNHLGYLLTRILKAENKIASEREKNEDNETQGEPKPRFSEGIVDILTKYVDSCHPNEGGEDDETNDSD